jgi:hypothetical protein
MVATTTKIVKKTQRNTSALTKKIEKLTFQIQMLQAKLDAASTLRVTLHAADVADDSPPAEIE